MKTPLSFAYERSLLFRFSRFSYWVVAYFFVAFLWSRKARTAFSQILFYKNPISLKKCVCGGGGYVSYIYDNSSDKRSVNLGDYVQTLAVENALISLFKLDLEKDFVPVARHRLSEYDSESAICIMQGWYEQEGLSFLPLRQSVVPVWIGTHFRGKTRETLRWLLRFHPQAFDGWEIGCRDLSTLDFCRRNGMNAYFSRCLTLTFPRRECAPDVGKVFCVNCPDEVVLLLKERFGNDLEVINQRSCYEGETKKPPYILKKEASSLLERYKREGRLVVTTALHCAQPCAAMGVPVVFIDPEYNECDRFSSFKNILPVYSVADLKSGKIDFNCEAPDIESLKIDMLENLRLSVLKAKGEPVDEDALMRIRNRIADFGS